MLPVTRARAPPACIDAAPANIYDDLALPLPAVSVPLRSTPVSTPTEMLSAQGNNLFVQQPGHAILDMNSPCSL